MHKPWCAYDIHRTARGNLLFPTTMYALSIELKKWSLVEGQRYQQKCLAGLLITFFFLYALTIDAKCFWEVLQDIPKKAQIGNNIFV